MSDHNGNGSSLRYQTSVLSYSANFETALLLLNKCEQKTTTNF